MHLIEKLRLIAARYRTLRRGGLARLSLPLTKIAPFIVTVDHRPCTLDSEHLRLRLAPAQMELFG